MGIQFGIFDSVCGFLSLVILHSHLSTGVLMSDEKEPETIKVLAQVAALSEGQERLENDFSTSLSEINAKLSSLTDPNVKGNRSPLWLILLSLAAGGGGILGLVAWLDGGRQHQKTETVLVEAQRLLTDAQVRDTETQSLLTQSKKSLTEIQTRQTETQTRRDRAELAHFKLNLLNKQIADIEKELGDASEPQRQALERDLNELKQLRTKLYEEIMLAASMPDGQFVQNDERRQLVMLLGASSSDPASTRSLVQLLIMLAESELQSGRYAKAVATYERAIELHPEPPYLSIVRNNLAYHLATVPDDSVRDPQRAVNLARLAISESPKRYPQMLHTLAVALVANGEMNAAIETMKEAVEIAPEALKGELLQRLEALQRKSDA